MIVGSGTIKMKGDSLDPAEANVRNHTQIVLKKLQCIP